MTNNDQMIVHPARHCYGQEEKDVAIEVINSEWYIESKYSDLFRKKLEEYLNVKYVNLTNSGSSANLVAVMALTTAWIPEDRRLKKGDEVITTALCFPTTISPIIYAGAIPVFVDIEEGNWNASVKQLEKAITDKTKAVILAHGLGNPFQVEKIKAICKEHNLYLIEDNCDALGATWNGEKTGGLGDIGTSSFYPAHHISTGEGGAVYTNDPLLQRSLFALINWGKHCFCRAGCDDACGKRYRWQLGNLPYGYDHKYTYSEMGFNLKMTDIQAAIGYKQMDRIAGFVSKRRANVKKISKIFAKYEKFFIPTVEYIEAEASWFGYLITLKEDCPFTRNEMAQYFTEHNILNRYFFCGNITKQPVFADTDRFKYRVSGGLKWTNYMMDNSFWIGCHPKVDDKQIDYIEKTLDNFIKKYI